MAVPAIVTARARARAEITNEIKVEARRQVAEGGAGSLSLRSVARELGMASSALYRYFASRDELLTALIIDAYDSIGSTCEEADRSIEEDDFAARWSAVCHAVRDWALDHRHEYALIYGSPVPGYHVPRATVGPATRASLTLARIVQAAHLAGRLHPPAGPPSPAGWDEAADRLSEQVVPGVPPDVVARTLVAWTQLFGLVSFELFGQLEGVVDDLGVLFSTSLGHMTRFLGLAPVVA